MTPNQATLAACIAAAPQPILARTVSMAPTGPARWGPYYGTAVYRLSLSADGRPRWTCVQAASRERRSLALALADADSHPTIPYVGSVRNRIIGEAEAAELLEVFDFSVRPAPASR